MNGIAANLLKKIPAKFRLTMYAVAALLLLAWAAWDAAQGDWRVAVGKFLTSVVAATAGANVELPGLSDDNDDAGGDL